MHYFNTKRLHYCNGMKRINRPLTLATCNEKIINVIVEIKKATKQKLSHPPKQESSFRNTHEMYGGSHLIQVSTVI